MPAECATSPWSILSDLMLAAAAIYVTVLALCGRWLEYKGTKNDDAALMADAKLFYAATSLSKTWVLAFVLLGTLIKVGLTLGEFT